MGRRHAVLLLLSSSALVGLYACVGDEPSINNIIEADSGAPDVAAVDATVADTSPSVDAGVDAPPADGACLIDATGGVSGNYAFGLAGNILDVALDSANNRIEVGGFSGTTAFGTDASAITSQGPEDGYVAKRGTNAAVAWFQGFAGAASDTAVSVAVDGNDDVYVSGETVSATLTIAGTSYPNPNGAASEMGFVTKLHGTDGSVAWTQIYALAAAAPAGSAARCVQVAANGNYLAIGCHFNGAALTYAGVDAAATTMAQYPGGNVALFTLDPATGNVLSQTQIGALDAGSNLDAGEVSLWGLDITSKGFPIASGSFTAPYIKDKALDISIARQSATSDGWLTELNTAGKADWQKDFASDGGVTFLTTHTDGLGNALVIGDFNGAANFGGAQLAPVGGNDVYVANIPGGSTGGGKPLWEKVLGGAADDHGVAITYDSCERPIAIAQVTGNVVVDGVAFPQQQPGGDLVSAVVKFTTGGTVLWAHGPAPTSGNKLTPTSLAGYSGGNTVMCGAYQGTVDLGDNFVPTSSGINPFEIFFSR